MVDKAIFTKDTGQTRDLAVLSKHSITQLLLADSFGLDPLAAIKRG